MKLFSDDLNCFSTPNDLPSFGLSFSAAEAHSNQPVMHCQSIIPAIDLIHCGANCLQATYLTVTVLGDSGIPTGI